MRKTDREKHSALGQFLGLVLIIVILGGVSLWEDQRPADAKRLSLPVSELRAQSAELQGLSDENGAGHLQPRFLRNHTLQLLENQRDTREELAGLKPWPELGGAQRDSLDDAQKLESQLHALGSSAPTDERGIEVLRDRFRGRERELRN